MNRDFQDVLESLLRSGARFLVVGALALAVHGVPRATGDLDIWIQTTEDNVDRVWEALLQFGAPLATIGVSRNDLRKEGTVVQIGLPPRRLDILTGLSGVSFEQAWGARTLHTVGTFEVPFLGREDLIRNKRSAGRLKDLADVEALER